MVWFDRKYGVQEKAKYSFPNQFVNSYKKFWWSLLALQLQINLVRHYLYNVKFFQYQNLGCLFVS